MSKTFKEDLEKNKKIKPDSIVQPENPKHNIYKGTKYGEWIKQTQWLGLDESKDVVGKVFHFKEYILNNNYKKLYEYFEEHGFDKGRPCICTEFDPNTLIMTVVECSSHPFINYTGDPRFTSGKGFKYWNDEAGKFTWNYIRYEKIHQIYLPDIIDFTKTELFEIKLNDIQISQLSHEWDYDLRQPRNDYGKINGIFTRVKEIKTDYPKRVNCKAWFIVKGKKTVIRSTTKGIYVNKMFIQHHSNENLINLACQGHAAKIATTLFVNSIKEKTNSVIVSEEMSLIINKSLKPQYPFLNLPKI